MDIGRVRPGFHEGEELTKWECPILLFNEDDTDKKFTVTSIYVDEGILCIDFKDKE